MFVGEVSGDCEDVVGSVVEVVARYEVVMEVVMVVGGEPEVVATIVGLELAAVEDDSDKAVAVGLVVAEDDCDCNNEQVPSRFRFWKSRTAIEPVCHVRPKSHVKSDSLKPGAVLMSASILSCAVLISGSVVVSALSWVSRLSRVVEAHAHAGGAISAR